jgi:hypothetical protein
VRFRTGGGNCRPNWGTPGDRDREASFLGLDPVWPRCGIVPDPDVRIGTPAGSGDNAPSLATDHRRGPPAELESNCADAARPG